MELILAALGVAFIIAALVVAKIQGQNYLRLQERTLERAQEAGLYELQAAADDLTRQLEAEAERLKSELEESANKLQELLAEARSFTQEASLSLPKPQQAPKVPEKPKQAPGGAKASGRWGERERMIREMHELGLTAEAIAKELGIGKGEVRLVLDLSKGEEIKS